jgi:hypothetical protein
MSESYKPAPDGTNNFQKPLGLAIRRHCAPLLDLEPLCTREDYLARRAALGSDEVARRFVRACDVEAHLIDTGHRSSELSTPEEFFAIARKPVREIVRIEAVIEHVAASGCSAADFPARFAEELTLRTREAVGVKSVVAYRTTFKIDQTAPPVSDVVVAFGEWMKATGRGRPRLVDPTIIRHGLWIAAEICRTKRFPMQLHVGFGDPDVYMHACDPTHFTDFIRNMEDWQVPITLLHNYPFVREAAWLSEIFQNVYYDVGVILNFTGPSSLRIMQEALELGPFTKQLYSSDAFGLPEFHYLGAVLFRRTLGTVLDSWLQAGDCTAHDVEQIFGAVARNNAARIYPIG